MMPSNTGKSAAAQQGDSGSQQPPGPQPKRTIKRRVVKKAFYSDEEVIQGCFME